MMIMQIRVRFFIVGRLDADNKIGPFSVFNQGNQITNTVKAEIYFHGVNDNCVFFLFKCIVLLLPFQKKKNLYYRFVRCYGEGEPDKLLSVYGHYAFAPVFHYVYQLLL